MGTNETSNDRGRSVKYSEEVFLEAISDLAEDEPELITSAPNVHTWLVEHDKDISQRAVYNRLYDIRERGLVERMEVSPNFYGWTVTDEGEKVLEKARPEGDEEEEKRDIGGATSV